MKCYYETLGLLRTATAGEIKKQYRTLANQFHPDKNNGDKIAEEKFKELGEAYKCLSNPDKRAAYDRETFPQATDVPFMNTSNSTSNFSFADAFAAIVLIIVAIAGIVYLADRSSKSRPAI